MVLARSERQPEPFGRLQGFADAMRVAFAPRRVLRHALVVGATAASGAVVAALMPWLDSPPEDNWPNAWLAGVTTLLFAYVWFHRIPRRGKLPYLTSIGYAAANAACVALVSWIGRTPYDDHPILVVANDVVRFVTLGAMVWVPLLLVGLAVLGLPMTLAQRKSTEGLSASQLAQRFAAAMVLLPTALAASTGRNTFENAYLPAAGFWFMRGCAALAFACSAFVIVTVTVAEARRRAFVRRAALGEQPGFRVTETEGQRVLVETTSLGEGYRGGSLDEPICSLDEDDHAILVYRRSR